MKNIAYKISRGNPNLPDGFITDDHFETENDQEEGYLITSVGSFSQLLASNGPLMVAWEASKGIVTAENKPQEAEKPDLTRVPEKQSAESLAAIQNRENEQAANAALFQQFLAWKASQSNS